MTAVSYFSAVIGRQGGGWRALDVDVEEVESLDELAEHMRSAAHADGPVVAVLEREDEWFALVRADAGSSEDHRVFVSDLDAAERSQFAELLAPVRDLDDDAFAALRRPAPKATDDEDDDELVVVDDDEDDAPAVADDDPVDPPSAWAGDPSLLEDLGVSPRELVDLVVESVDDPGTVLADVGERCGFDDQLDALR
ncbi:tRNA adenosine deaminase-associated protein [Angustibacter aerolatus]